VGFVLFCRLEWKQFIDANLISKDMQGIKISNLARVILIFVGITALVSVTAAGAQQRQVRDLLGRDLSVPATPRRVVALAPNITEIVYALGQAHRLVGATTYSDFPPAAALLPKVGSYVHLDLERIVALNPDLCLAIKDGNPITAVSRLESFNIPVYAVDPRNLDSVMDTIMRIGHLLQAEERADMLVSDMQARIQAVVERVGHANHRPKVFFQIGIAPIVSVGTNTFIHELIEMAGAHNLAAGNIAYPRFSKEQVLGLLPDVIIVTSMAREAAFERIRNDWYQWQDLPAVQHERVFVQDSNLFDRPSPRLVDALEILARLLHPELFEDS